MRRALLLVLALLGLAGAARADCAAPSGPCQIAFGDYHVALPATERRPIPAVMFLHGAGGDGAGVIGNRPLVASLTARGYAVLAPTGSRLFRDGPGRSWSFYPGWEGRDEAEFLTAVVADAATRFAIDPDAVLLAGFSAGGFMVTYLACEAPESFAAYAPVSGGFWRPHPAGCAGPVRLLHTHGWSDTTVPLEGRFLGGGRFQQGDIFAGLEIWRAANRCPDQRPDAYAETGPFWRRSWTGCAPGSALELALFAGGHTVPEGWVDLALDWFEALPPRRVTRRP